MVSVWGRNVTGLSEGVGRDPGNSRVMDESKSGLKGGDALLNIISLLVLLEV